LYPNPCAIGSWIWIWIFSADVLIQIRKLKISFHGGRILQAADMPEVLCLSLDPGTVDTTMLRTGWNGCYGIPLKEANDTFWIATAQV
jgi:hypothetical protein